ncbi:carboxypeptidase regulatory-like domain-containing protein [Cryobacterium sp. SO2]|uniref:MSCRAMM family protein n=1 Tax=Cryobacterium sp. SO2 TaxID=1897060 RepID=UPI00223E3EE0|nr:carboxypeptidase regulatory-like domain-containing protein [Cryobacterium sp. SO2]WEO77973.1 carboxypeptidase regulatory-like domain-containing protein [Cryobacterium sp. SO2]
MPHRAPIRSALTVLGLAGLLVATTTAPVTASARTTPAVSTAVVTPVPTEAPTPTGLPASTETATATATPTATFAATETPTPTATASATPTTTPTPTPTGTASPSPSVTPTSAPTPTQPASTFAGETSITGRVTDQATGAPIAGASVYIYTPSGAYGSAIPVSSTDADGNYTFYSLDVRSYTLEFTSTGYRTEWWGGQASQDAADTFDVAAGESVTDKDATLLPVDSISGTVSAGSPAEPLAGATVSAFDADGTLQATATVTSDGSYTLGGLAPGAFTLRFTPPAGSTVVAQWWHDKAHPSTAAVIRLTADTPVTGKNVTLAAGATVTGRVSDTATGGGIAGAWVYAYVASVQNGVSGGSIASARTNARGDYTLTGLAAGGYSLQFSGGSANGSAGYLREWWVNKTSRSAAIAFTLTAGKTIDGADAALVPTASISGTVYAAGARNVGLNAATVAAIGADGRLSRSTTTNSSGEYTLTGLPAGAYTLRFSAPPGTTFVAEWWHDDAQPTTATVIRVTAGQNVTGKTAELAAAATRSAD